MNIRKLIYPLFVNLEMRWPNMILLLIELTFESVKNNEQFFIDQVRNFRNAIEIVKINFYEKHFVLFPQGKKLQMILGSIWFKIYVPYLLPSYTSRTVIDIRTFKNNFSLLIDSYNYSIIIKCL